MEEGRVREGREGMRGEVASGREKGEKVEIGEGRGEKG